MPKMKTKKGVRKRMRLTKSGKAKFFRATKGHLLTGKRSKRKRFLRRGGIVSPAETAMIKKCLPYGA